MADLPLISIRSRPPKGIPLVLGVFEDEGVKHSRLARKLVRRLQTAADDAEWTARTDRQLLVPLLDESPTAVLLLGLGPRDELDAAAISDWLQKGVSRALALGSREMTIALPAHPRLECAGDAEQIARSLALSGYRFDRYRAADPPPVAERIFLLAPEGAEASWKRGAARASILADASAWARDLANTPPNEATPDWMAEQARQLAIRHDMRIDILGLDELREKEMGGMLAVGGGSENPPRFVRMEWGEGERTIALVGKGVTFDTGGISIKPSASMDEMKYDKCGACTVLGVLSAAAELELPLRIRAYLPFAENMPDGKAYRPSDIVRCYGGKTVEIINTDAEGRMILADALAWAAEEEADDIVEMSTLTGACVVALGTQCAGLHTPSDDLADELLSAAEQAGERLWRLPLFPEFVSSMRGRHADLRNSGGRWGGANLAAGFLSAFVESHDRWAHIDLAGPAYIEGNDPGPVGGATGYGVALVTQWLEGLAGQA